MRNGHVGEGGREAQKRTFAELVLHAGHHTRYLTLILIFLTFATIQLFNNQDLGLQNSISHDLCDIDEEHKQRGCVSSR